MSDNLKEFHFGIEAVQTVDVKIMAADAEEAQALFMAASETKDGMAAYSRTVLARTYQVLGMVEGPLPEHVAAGELAH